MNHSQSQSTTIRDIVVEFAILILYFPELFKPAQAQSLNF